MKRAMLIVAVATLCVAGSAVADGGLIGSGTRTEDGGGTIGSGTAAGQMMGSGNAVGQIMGSGGFTMTTQDVFMGSGGRSEDSRQVLGSGARQQVDGGYLGSGLAVRELRLADGSSLLVVSSGEGTFIIAID